MYSNTETMTPLDAIDQLSHATASLEFLQSTLTISGDGETTLTLDAKDKTGLYYLMTDVIDKINRASGVLHLATKG